MSCKLFDSIVERFATSNEPFEEFATTIAETALFDLPKESWNDLAQLVIKFDWCKYTNERNGKTISLADVLRDGVKAERDHVQFIRTFTEFHHHDHSKDDFYILICCLRFHCPGFDIAKYRWFNKFCDIIVFRFHYKTERHHPEYELLVEGGECSLKDVEETAVDRMARNFQFSNDGLGDASAMMKFKPSWMRNADRNSHYYADFVAANYEKIGKLWQQFISTND